MNMLKASIKTTPRGIQYATKIYTPPPTNDYSV